MNKLQKNGVQIGGLLLLIILSFSISLAAEKDKQQQEPPVIDWVDIAYRKARVIGGHATAQETLDLINQLITLGHLETARELLEKGPELPERYRSQHLDSLLSLETAEYFRLTDGDPGRNSHKTAVQDLLLELSAEKQLSPEQLTRYLKKAEGFNVPEAVIAISLQLAERKTNDMSKWWHKAGQWSLANQQPTEAIEYLYKAYQAAQSEEIRKTYWFTWLRALQNDGQQKIIITELETALSDSELDQRNLEQLALFCLEVERPDLAWKFYGRLAETDLPNLLKWQEQAVRWALAANQPLAAARLLKKLARYDLSIKQQNILLRKELELLQLANRLEEAVDIAALLIEHLPDDTELLEKSIQMAMATEKIGQAEAWNSLLLKKDSENPELLQRQLDLNLAQSKTREAFQLIETLILQFPKNKELLDTGTNLALAIGQTGKAEIWNTRLLQMDPKNPKLLKKQAEIFLAKKQPEKAIESVRQLFQDNPNDIELQWELAHLEEWSGHPAAALDQWLQLSKTESNLEINEHIYRLSRMLNEQFIALNALTAIESQRQLTVDEVKDRIILYENIGDPEQAVIATTLYLKKHPQEYNIWLELAHLQMRSREYKQAAETWVKIASLFGRNKEETLFRSECYWRSGMKKKALEVMESYKGKLSGLDNLYHAKLLVELGWRYRRPELAKHSFDSLLEYYDKEQYFVLERLIFLQRDAGSIEEAVQFAIQSAESTDDPRFLMLALNIAAVSLKDEQVSWLLDKMESTDEDFSSVPLYWIIKAQRKYTQGEYKDAEKLYQKALSLDIVSITAKEGILWSLLSMGDKTKLAAQLDAWQSQALNHQELWLVYALSRQYLGQYQLAGIWYERLVATGSKDYGIILGYADALEASGATDRAYRLRMYAMHQLRPEAAIFIEKPTVLSETIKTYVNLLHRYGTVQQGEFWLRTLLQLHQGKKPSPWIYEVAISWYLNNNQHELAKIWLAKAHENRIKTPYWQNVLLALEEDNQEQLVAILAKSSQLDLQSKVTILEKLDRHQEALQLAEQGIAHNRSYSEQSQARAFAASLKQQFPHYWRSGYETTFSDLLDTRQAFLTGRYTFNDTPISLEAMYQHFDFSSSVYSLDTDDQADDLSFTLFTGHGEQGGNLSFGMNNHPSDTIGYANVKYYQQLLDGILAQLELAIHAIPEVDSILQPATLQNRLDATIIGSVAMDYYYYVDLWGREYNTRDGNGVAKGYGATAEIGFKQHWGRFEWLAGLQGNFEHNYDRKLPDDLKQMLPSSYTIDDVVAKEASSLLLGGRVGRGSIRDEYPSTGSLRYFASAWFGHTWPQNELTVYLRAGSGVRILGNDELSIQVLYNQSGGVVGRNDDSGISLQYQYNF